MTEINEETLSTTLAAMQTLITDAKRLGLTWTLRPGTISKDTTPTDASSTVAVIQDGDTVAMLATTLVSRLNMQVGDRVMTLMIPPGGLYVIGTIGGGGGGYLLSQSVIVTGTGDTNFTKASYPGIRAVKVKVQGGGGGSGGAASAAASNASVAGGGGGGGYAESWVLASQLFDTETITVGAGGTAGSAGNNAGGAGNSSLFGSWAIGGGGGAGTGGAAATTAGIGGSGGAGAAGNVGNLFTIVGGDGSNGWRQAGSIAQFGHGGNSFMAGVKRTSASGGGAGGLNGYKYGGGASGAFDVGSSTNRAGAAGGDGIVIVEIYL